MAIQAQLCSDNIGFWFPLYGSQDLNSNNNMGDGDFIFESQLKQQQYQQHHFQQLQNQWPMDQNMVQGGRNNLLVPSLTSNTKSIPNIDNYSSMLHHQNMAFQMEEKQRDDIDHYITSQSERLRLALQEQAKQQLSSLLQIVESRALFLSRQKDEEIAQVKNRGKELEQLLRRLEAENQEWKRLARENEATVLSLSGTLEQVKERVSCYLNHNNYNGAEDAESNCSFGMEGRRKEEEKRGGDNIGEREGRRVLCKRCNIRRFSVVFLPCRHLCLCNACAGCLEFCPVCNGAKKASIKALIS